MGVDGFRADTAAHVPPEFWRRFFHDEDGIYPHARRLGKGRLLTFGEAFSGSPAYGGSGETKITGYLGSDADPVFNSMLGFPMNSEIGRVFARIYITTWDGAYSRLAPEPSEWAFGGAEPDAPKIHG